MRSTTRRGPQPCCDGRHGHQSLTTPPPLQEQLESPKEGIVEKWVEESEGSTNLMMVTELGPFIELIRSHGRFF